MNRVTARENLMQMLYQMEIQGDYSEASKNQFLLYNYDDPKETQLKYFESVYNAFACNKDAIDKLISDNAKDWKLERLAKVDLAVLRVCIAESLFMSDETATPLGAAINEAVKISKKYGSDESGKFVNGILGNIAKSHA